MRLALFDYAVVESNPIGSCHLRLLRDLCHEHEFTVFAARFENPCPERIRWVRVPVIARPLILLFVSYHSMAPVFYAIERWIRRRRFDRIQMVESTLLFGDVCYCHFCHRAYLKREWQSSRPSGLRRVFKWLDHSARASLEARSLRRAKWVVVPSSGLARELEREYPFAAQKIRVIPNFVETGKLRPSGAFDRAAFRGSLGLRADDFAFVFVALGHFERKGLPQALVAMSTVADPRLKLVVVGGAPSLVGEYRRRALEAGLEAQVIFAGLQRDVRPYLWAADAFLFPTAYEACSLAIFQAAAAGLPLLATRTNGVEEVIADGRSGFFIGRSPDEVAEGIRRIAALPPEARSEMGKRAQTAVEAFGADAFVRAWGDFYNTVLVA